jgi:hypothetical protein
MAGVEVAEQTKAAIEAVESARKSVQAACDLLTAALSQLTPLVSVAEGPVVGDTVTSYNDARAVLTAQLAVLDRALAAAAA